jgi:hypothetical protein
MTGSVVLVVGALIVLALAARRYLVRERRSDEMRHVASQLGFVYSHEDASAVESVGFELFAHGEERGSEHVLSGVWEGSRSRSSTSGTRRSDGPSSSD